MHVLNLAAPFLWSICLGTAVEITELLSGSVSGTVSTSDVMTKKISIACG
jgi:hypothetical protein